MAGFGWHRRWRCRCPGQLVTTCRLQVISAFAPMPRRPGWPIFAECCATAVSLFVPIDAAAFIFSALAGGRSFASSPQLHLVLRAARHFASDHCWYRHGWPDTAHDRVQLVSNAQWTRWRATGQSKPGAGIEISCRGTSSPRRGKQEPWVADAVTAAGLVAAHKLAHGVKLPASAALGGGAVNPGCAVPIRYRWPPGGSRPVSFHYQSTSSSRGHGWPWPYGFDFDRSPRTPGKFRASCRLQRVRRWTIGPPAGSSPRSIGRGRLQTSVKTIPCFADGRLGRVKKERSSTIFGDKRQVAVEGRRRWFRSVRLAGRWRCSIRLVETRSAERTAQESRQDPAGRIHCGMGMPPCQRSGTSSRPAWLGRPMVNAVSSVAG